MSETESARYAKSDRIAVANREIAGMDPDDYEVISEKVSYRLAQRAGAYEILKYVREVIKRHDAQVTCPGFFGPK